MRSLSLLLFILPVAMLPLAAQEVNTTLASINIDGSPLSVIGMGPITATGYTDSDISVNMRGMPGTPVVMLVGSYSAGANQLPVYGFNLDILAYGPNQDYSSNIYLDGYSFPSPGTWTDQTGNLTFIANLVACTAQPNGSTICNLPATMNRTFQAITNDPTNAPWNVRSTAAARLTMVNGYKLFALSGDNSTLYNFLGGFQFPFYNGTYGSCYVSANGFVSFGGTDNGFPNPSVGSTRSGVRRIMNYYSDLVPETSATQPKIYAQMFTDNGMRRIRIVHSRLAEFSNTTGPHGGECIISENGDISVYVHPYNAQGSINTVVGITPGGNLDPGGGAGATSYGRDLSQDVVGGPTVLGINKSAFELFDLGSTFPANPLDLAGFNAPNGITYIRAPFQSSYTVQ